MTQYLTAMSTPIDKPLNRTKGSQQPATVFASNTSVSGEVVFKNVSNCQQSSCVIGTATMKTYNDRVTRAQYAIGNDTLLIQKFDYLHRQSPEIGGVIRNTMCSGCR